MLHPAPLVRESKLERRGLFCHIKDGPAPVRAMFPGWAHSGHTVGIRGRYGIWLSQLPQFSARGNVETLAALVRGELTPEDGALLHVAGTTVAGNLSGALGNAGFDVRSAVLYEARAIDNLGEETVGALNRGALDGVLLFSPRTGVLFEGLVREAGLADRLVPLTAYCLSPKVADKVRDLPWADVVLAAEPNQDALLAVIAQPE